MSEAPVIVVTPTEAALMRRHADEIADEGKGAGAPGRLAPSPSSAKGSGPHPPDPALTHARKLAREGRGA